TVTTQCGTWASYSSADLGTGGSNMNAVAVVSANDMRAVGEYAVNNESRALIAQRDGNTWTHLVSPRSTITCGLGLSRESPPPHPKQVRLCPPARWRPALRWMRPCCRYIP